MSDFIAGPITDPLTQRLTPASTTLVDGASINLDASVADVFVVTINGNHTIEAPTNSKGGQLLTLVVKQGGGGAFTPLFDAVYKGVEGVSFAQPAGAVTVLQFLCQPASGGFEYSLVSCSTSAGGLASLPQVSIVGPASSNNSVTGLPAVFDGKKVFVTIDSIVGVGISADPVCFSGQIAGGTLTVACFNTTTGALEPVAAGCTVTLNVLVDLR